MLKHLLLLLLSIPLFFACQQENITTQLDAGLHKIVNPTPEQIERLRELGTEIIVQEEDYIIIRADASIEAVTVTTQPVEEADFIHRLIRVPLDDSTALQTVVNAGVDLWTVQNDTAIARAFDIDIREIRNAGLDVLVVAQDASKWVEERL